MRVTMSPGSWLPIVCPSPEQSLWLPLWQTCNDCGNYLRQAPAGGTLKRQAVLSLRHGGAVTGHGQGVPAPASSLGKGPGPPLRMKGEAPIV